MKKYITNNWITILFIFLLIFFGLISYVSATRESLTFDEIVDLQEGRNAILYHLYNIDPYNPPFTREIAVLPYIFSKEFYVSEQILLQNPMYGRLPSIFFGLALLVSIFLFVKKYIGEKEALLSAFLIAFEPNILANSHYITMDIGLTLFVFLSFVFLIQLIKKKTVKNIVFLSITVGLGLVTKISFIPYFFLSAAIISFAKYKSGLFVEIRKKSKAFLLSAACTLFVVWAAYLFSTNVVVKPRQDNSRISVKLAQYAEQHNLYILSNTLSFLENQPVPLGDYAATLKNNALRSLHSNKCFFLGNFYSSCQWYFMPINLMLKIPMSLLILFIVSGYVFLNKKKKDSVVGYILVFIAVILGTVVVMRITPLVRYVLPLVPFFAIFATYSLVFWKKTRVRKIILIALLVWYVFGTLKAFPHFISYANEFTLGQKTFLLTDSNMDWGQSLPDVQQFHKRNNNFLFSYFGRDNADLYGLTSSKSYGSYKANEICEFHQVGKVVADQPILISVSNWYACGYNKVPRFAKKNIKTILSDSILIF